MSNRPPDSQSSGRQSESQSGGQATDRHWSGRIPGWLSTDRLPLVGAVRRVPWSVLPVTTVVFAVFCWLLLELGVEPLDLAGVSPAYDPLSVLSGMVLHSGPDHYWGNMRLLVPFGIVLTLLSNNRHVLAVILVSHVPAAMVYGLVGGTVVGSSGVAFGIAAATLVRSVGAGLQDASVETLQTTILGLLTPFVASLLVVAVFDVPPGIAHFGHVFGFVFGAGYESAVVLAGHRDDTEHKRPPTVPLQ